jgi:reverse gyrase
MKAIYNGLCLNCNGEISDERLFQSGICENCINVNVKERKEILEILRKNGKLLSIEKIFNFYENFENFSLFFKKALKQRMLSLQEMWAKRVLLNKSFSIVAPTGVGKTVFGIISALYFASMGKKSYIIVPTTLLVQQIVEKIQIFSNNLERNFNVVYYHGLLGDKEKKEAIKKILEGNFDILVTTDRFIITKSKELKGVKFDFVFVDDVDSFLKSPKNIDKILLLLGFDLEIIDLSMKLLEIKDNNEKEKIREKIREFKRNNKIGILVVSGATIKAKRTKRIRLFEELLDFQIGFKPEFVRNIKDVYIEKSKSIEEHVLELIKEFGGGALVFVPQSLGKEFADYINDYLIKNGIKSYVYKKPEENILSDFQNGKYDVLIGVASFRNPLARGIDLPERVRYVIFAGVPRMEFKLSWEEYNPIKLLTILKNIRPFIKDELNATRIINNLNKIIPMKSELIEKIKEAIETNKKLEGFEEYAKNVIIEAREFLSKNITPELIELISKSKEISIEKRGNYFYLIVSDATGYIQASGRCSRMFAGGVSRGISFVIKDDEKAFYSLGQKLSIILGEFSWIKFDLEKVRKWFKKVDEDREIIKNIREGKLIAKFRDYIKPALLIVESPTKAKTISKFFGKPFRRKIGDVTVFEISTGKFVLNIVASMGHVFDLIPDKGFHGVKIDNNEFIPIYDLIKKCKNCGNQFTGEICPKCKSKDYYSKEGFIKAIRELASEVKYVFLATDPDAEGEKISYDLLCAIYPINNKIERLEFHEITKSAFIKALNNRRKIDLKLVEAQLVRRIEDRWIGFELSQVLWDVFKNRRLSAGRVQTPVLGWIIERVKEARKRKKVLSLVLSNDLKISIEDPKEVKVSKAIISNLSEEERVIYPAPPYTTDSLLRDASLELNFSAEKTMRIAQDLFEAGLCTYHRTDSTTVSNVGISIAKEYIQEKFPELFVPRKYQKEGAHECIRPTRVIDVERLKYLIQTGILKLPIKLTSDHFKLYDLIFRRFIASQMKEVIVKYQKFKVEVNGNEKIIENPVEIVKDGFNKIIPIKLYDRVKEGEYEIKYSKLLHLPATKLFTQGEVIAMMKERGIGRPSTYAKIISTLLERGYVFEIKNKLINTTLGLKIYSYLSEKYSAFVSEETTRKLEELMDKVAEGKIEYQEVLKNIYNEILTIREKA